MNVVTVIVLTVLVAAFIATVIYTYDVVRKDRVDRRHLAPPASHLPDPFTPQTR